MDISPDRLPTDVANTVPDGFSIARLIDLSTEDLSELYLLCQAEQLGMVVRLFDEWESGKFRFDQPGEAFFKIGRDGKVVGVGGVIRDPYGADGQARMRRVYIHPEFRSFGLGRAIVHHITDWSRSHFHTLRLRTDQVPARAFYARLGFTFLGDGETTHELALI